MFLNKKSRFLDAVLFAAMLIRLASQVHNIPFLPVEQPTACSRVKCQGRAEPLKANNSRPLV